VANLLLRDFALSGKGSLSLLGPEFKLRDV
jgi:hypothetical protein